MHGAEARTRHASVTTLLSAGSEICQLSSSISVSGVSVCLARVVLDCTAVDLHLANAARSEVEAALKPR